MREAVKEGQRVGDRSGTEAGNSYWLKYSQQLQSVCAACRLTAAVSPVLPWYTASSPFSSTEFPRPPAMFMPSLDPPERSAWCPSLCSMAHRVSSSHADWARCSCSHQHSVCWIFSFWFSSISFFLGTVTATIPSSAGKAGDRA